MKNLLMTALVLSASQYSFAMPEKDCLGGSFPECQRIFNQYGSQSNREGAVEMFVKACSSQKLQVICQITSSSKSETLKKSLELAKTNSAIFVINGSELDKIYQISKVP